MKIQLSALIILCLLISSCQQEISEFSETPPTTQPPTTDSTKLTLYVELDTTLIAGQDTIRKVSFTYNAQGSLTRMTDSTRSGSNFFVTTTNYFYQGNNPHPLKITDYSAGSHPYGDTVFISFDNNGIITKDSTRMYDLLSNNLTATDVINYNQAGSNLVNITRSYRSFTSSFTFANTSDIHLSKQNGNIILQTDSAQILGKFQYEATQDNHPNPFVKVDMLYPTYWGNWSQFHSQNNNVTEFKDWQTSTTLNAHLKFSYSYRADGYPTSGSKTDMLNPAGNRRLIFIYQ